MSKYSTSWNTPTYPTTEYPTPSIALDVELLKATCQIQGKSGYELDMQNYLEDHLIQLGLEPIFDHKGNIYCTKGEAEIYPCMVAHMDTVHDYHADFHIAVSVDEKIMYAYSRNESNSNLPMLSPTVKQVGTGGDDRVGISIALQMLATLPAMKVAFFREEEIGGANGSGSANMKFFENVSVVLQCDRKGGDEWVQTASGTKLASDEFITLISPILTHHKYKTIQSGGFTDVVNLKSKGNLGVCAANMSCGYYNPHSDSETIHLPTMQNTLSMVHDVLILVGETRQVHVKPVYVQPQNKAIIVNLADDGLPLNWAHYSDRTWVNRKEPGSTYYAFYKVINDRVVLGPCTYMEVRPAEAKFRKELLEEHRTLSGQNVRQLTKEQRKALVDWVKKEETWTFCKHDKVWEKVVDQYVVAYASTIGMIPQQEINYQELTQAGMSPAYISLKLHEAEKDEVSDAHGLTAVERDYDNMDEEEFQALRLSMPDGVGAFEDRYMSGYKCYHCKQPSLGMTSKTDTTFWCDVCMCKRKKSKATELTKTELQDNMADYLGGSFGY